MLEYYKGYKIEIKQDSFPESPREWHNVSKMVCNHKRYDLPNEVDFDFGKCNSWDEVESALRKDYPVVVPLYAYDHSCFDIKMGGYQPYWVHAYWDAGKIGYIVVDRESLIKEFGIKRLGKNNIKKVMDVLEGEVEEFNQYINCDIWIVEIFDEEEELVDSGSALFGYDDTLQSAYNTIDSLIVV